MKAITLLLEDDEQFILRAIIKQLEIMSPDIEGGDFEPLKNMSKKIVEATNDLGQEWKNDIGKLQKSVRAVRGTPEYKAMINASVKLNELIVEEMKKLDNKI